MRLRAVAAALAVLLAGCLAPGAEDVTPALAPPAAPAAPLPSWAHTAEGFVDLPEWGAPSFRLSVVGEPGAEPTLGVTSSGAIFFAAYEKIMRSTDGGASWRQVSTLASSPVTLDPYLFVDVETDRVYSAQLYVGCTWLSWSDDDGATWTTNPVACGTPVNDHQKMVAADPAGPLPTLRYENVLYYCFNQVVQTACATSLDGGLTWTPARLVFPGVDTGKLGPSTLEDGRGVCGGVNGDPAAGPGGVVYVPRYFCGRAAVGVSLDGGLTWSTHVAAEKASTACCDPEIAVDDSGTAFLAYQGDDALVHLTRSDDQGRTWSEPQRVTPPGVNSTKFVHVVTGDSGRVAVAYLGTKADHSRWASPYSDHADPDARWHLYVTYALDAKSEKPTFVTVQVTPDDDPVQIGSLHNGGGADPDRNLLDFMDLQRDAEGRVYVAFADGCTGGCDEADASRDDLGTVAILGAGPSLLAEKGALAPLPAASDAG